MNKKHIIEFFKYKKLHYILFHSHNGCMNQLQTNNRARPIDEEPDNKETPEKMQKGVIHALTTFLLGCLILVKNWEAFFLMACLALKN